MLPILAPFGLIVIYFFSGGFVLTKLVEEKESGMRESLKIMSLNQNSYGMSYFIFTGITIILQSLVMGLLVGIPGKFTNDDGLLLVPLFILYGVANVSFNMTLSTLFQDSKLANQLALVIQLLPTSFWLYLMTSGYLGQMKKDEYYIQNTIWPYTYIIMLFP